ncbi:hypothetical protein DFP72DRAFT_82163 [Ephemerocybe angulata]|uniref:Uncharacterized protein n=1 Tax=Ephemerocybe angulata TaxID=980116 RepID=A0A8H6HDX6_9AGAR|nr:hypothetical protein DFP72DRAFT_82163 [Tulosesus angulatus]
MHRPCQLNLDPHPSPNLSKHPSIRSHAGPFRRLQHLSRRVSNALQRDLPSVQRDRSDIRRPRQLAQRARPPPSTLVSQHPALVDQHDAQPRSERPHHPSITAKSGIRTSLDFCRSTKTMEETVHGRHPSLQPAFEPTQVKNTTNSLLDACSDTPNPTPHPIRPHAPSLNRVSEQQTAERQLPVHRTTPQSSFNSRATPTRPSQTTSNSNSRQDDAAPTLARKGRVAPAA